MKYLIAGLGNIGASYKMNRHNIGYQIIDRLAAIDASTPISTVSLASVAQLTYKGRKLLLAKPTTYMNHSGQAIRSLLQSYRIPLEQLLVLTDDLHLPFGKLRLRKKGGHGGHNGLRDIESKLSSTAYARLRIGIGSHFKAGQQADYVLEDFTIREQELLPTILEKAREIALSFCWRGATHTMDLYN